LVEAVTYRMAPHATADDPSAYIDAERVAQERERECVGRYERYLRRLGLLDDALAESVRAEALATMREAITIAEALEPPSDDVIFDRAYASPPAALRRDHEELRRLLAQERL
jgi:pyruvate dehydrogenase E1 component alpha subunit